MILETHGGGGSTCVRPRLPAQRQMCLRYPSLTTMIAIGWACRVLSFFYITLVWGELCYWACAWMLAHLQHIASSQVPWLPQLTTMIAIGCASLLNPPKKASSRSCTSQLDLISASKDRSSARAGSSPSMSRNATSAKEGGGDGGHVGGAEVGEVNPLDASA
jgi:hypothetical protein